MRGIFFFVKRHNLYTVRWVVAKPLSFSSIIVIISRKFIHFKLNVIIFLCVLEQSLKRMEQYRTHGESDMKKPIPSLTAKKRAIPLWLIAAVFLSTVPTYSMPNPTDIVVAADNSGDFGTLQQAVDAVPENSSKRTVIFIKKGTYNETVTIPSSKKNILLYGKDSAGVVITYKTEKILDLATLEVYATGFMAYNLTIENTSGPTYGPAQALRQEADKSIYVKCRIIGNQDTYRNARVRSFTKDCYIEGTVDFIFGAGTVVFEDCQLYAKGGSAITAASTEGYVPYGYVFKNCVVTVQSGKSTTLGRPWRDYAAVAFIECELSSGIKPEGWDNWDKPEREATSRYCEYGNYGPGANTDRRVSWADMLTTEEAEQYSTLNVLKTTYSSSRIIDNWNPYEEMKDAGISDEVVAVNKSSYRVVTSLEGSYGKEQVILYDLSGRLLMKTNKSLLDVFRLSGNRHSGVYVLNIRKGNHSRLHQLIKADGH